MKKLMLVVLTLVSFKAVATPVPLKMDCKGIANNGQAITLKSGANISWTRDPFYYTRNELLILNLGDQQLTLLSQNPELSKAAGVLHVTGISAEKTEIGFSLMGNLENNSAELQVSGIKKIVLECKFTGL